MMAGRERVSERESEGGGRHSLGNRDSPHESPLALAGSGITHARTHSGDDVISGNFFQKVLLRVCLVDLVIQQV